MTGPTIATLQVAVVLPEGAEPSDVLARIEALVRANVSESDAVHIDRFTTRPGAINSYLVGAIDMHQVESDGACFCGGWSPVSGGSHAEHVAAVFEESARAHAIVGV